MNKKITRIVGLFTLLTFVLLIGGTLAYWRVEGKTATQLETGQIRGSLVTEYAAESVLYPGSTLDQIIGVKNTGGIDMVVRLKVEIGWKDGRLENGLLHMDYNNEYWMLGPDGYYYYKGILAPGESSREPLVESFGLDKRAGNEYADQEGEVVMYMECLQAAASALETWGVSYQELGITEPRNAEGIRSEVIFAENREFEFYSQKVGVIPTFEQMVPGETRTQEMELKNRYEKDLTFYLKAIVPETNQGKTREMLEDYATIRLVGEGGREIYSGYVLNPHGEINLGEIKTGESEKITVILSLDPRMGNSYQSLQGEIQWQFIAQDEEDGSTKTPDDDGSTKKPDDDGSTKKPDDDGSTKTPDDDGSTKTPDDDGSTKKPDDDGSTKKPDDDGSTKKPDDDSSTKKPVGEGTTGLPKTGEDYTLVKLAGVMVAIAVIVVLYLFYAERKEKKRMEEQ